MSYHVYERGQHVHVEGKEPSYAISEHPYKCLTIHRCRSKLPLKSEVVQFTRLATKHQDHVWDRADHPH